MKGKNLIFFPEGRIVSSDGPGEFKSGIGLIARETNAAILPAKPIDSIMHFGQAFSLNEIITEGKLKPNASVQEISDYIRNKIIEL